MGTEGAEQALTTSKIYQLSFDIQTVSFPSRNRNIEGK